MDGASHAHDDAHDDANNDAIDDASDGDSGKDSTLRLPPQLLRIPQVQQIPQVHLRFNGCVVVPRCYQNG